MSEATTTADDGPEYNARGVFVIGPEFVIFSDVLAALIAEAKRHLGVQHYPPGTPDELYRCEKLRKGRRLFSAKEAERQRREDAA